MRDEQYATKLYKLEDNLLFVYHGKPKKIVLLLSTLHRCCRRNNQKKAPEIVKSYNEAKYGVDVVDHMARKYTFRTMTRR